MRIQQISGNGMTGQQILRMFLENYDDEADGDTDTTKWKYLLHIPIIHSGEN